MRTPGESESCESREVANVRVVKGKVVVVAECEDDDRAGSFGGGRWGSRKGRLEEGKERASRGGEDIL